jgi:hypothetical protein
MQLLDGLSLYEIILIVLGVLLFLVLLLRLVFKTPAADQWKWITALFLVSVIMIGYPSIQKIKYDNGMLEIEKWSREVERNPADTAARGQLARALGDIGNRSITSPEKLVNVAAANAALGDTLKALTYVDQAIKTEPGFSKARALQSTYLTPTVKAERTITKLASNPRDAESREELKQNLRELEKNVGAGSPLHLSLAKGYAALGDSAQALRFADSVLHRRPTSKEALNIASRFRHR